jgi:hypothetical protein
MTHELMHACRLDDTNNPNDTMYRKLRDSSKWCNFSPEDIKELKDTDASSSQTAISSVVPPTGVREVLTPHHITPPLEIDLAAATSVNIEPFDPANLSVMGVIWDSEHISANFLPTATAFHNEFFWIDVTYAAGSDRSYGILVVNDTPPPIGMYPHAIAEPEYIEVDWSDELSYIDGSASYHDDPSLELIMSWQVESEGTTTTLHVKPNPVDVFPVTQELEPGLHTITLWVCDDFAQCSSDTVTLKVLPPTSVNNKIWNKYK